MAQVDGPQPGGMVEPKGVLHPIGADRAVLTGSAKRRQTAGTGPHLEQFEQDRLTKQSGRAEATTFVQGFRDADHNAFATSDAQTGVETESGAPSGGLQGQGIGRATLDADPARRAAFADEVERTGRPSGGGRFGCLPVVACELADHGAQALLWAAVIRLARPIYSSGTPPKPKIERRRSTGMASASSTCLGRLASAGGSPAT